VEFGGLTGLRDGDNDVLGTTVALPRSGDVRDIDLAE
jgi:hypothetical protein